MSRPRFWEALCAAMILFAGCETVDQPKESQGTKQSEKRKPSKAEKKRKSLRDPISDMLKIERKESTPFLATSEELSTTERKAFSESWSSQHKEAEELHRKVRSTHDHEKDKKDSWVFY